MAKHAGGRDRVAGENAAAKGRYRRDLALWKIAVNEVVAGIGDLDADRAGIDIGVAGPARYPGVPGALALRHHLNDTAIFEDEIVRRHLARGSTQMLQRPGGVRHAGIVQHDHIRPATVLALAEIRRWHDVGNDAGIGLKNTTRHVRTLGKCPRATRRSEGWAAENAGLLRCGRTTAKRRGFQPLFKLTAH